MSRRTIYTIVAVVLLVHAALYFALTRIKPGEGIRSRPRPTFNSSAQTYRDAETGESYTYREFRVSTKLADPAMLKRIEEQRAAEAAATPKP